MDPGDGLVRLGEGREAEVFVRPDGEALKLMRDPALEPRVRREAAVLEQLGPSGLAPRFDEIVSARGRPGLVMERIEAPSLFSRLNAQPWQVWRAGTVLAATHLEVLEQPAPGSLPDLRDELRQRIERAPALPAPLASRTLDVLGELAPGDRLCHGDFHLGNLLGTWASPRVIDWADASRGDPVADVARTVLLHRVGALPPGTSRVIALAARGGRELLVHRYLSCFRRRAAAPEDLLRRWILVRAAARLYEGIDEEEDALVGIVSTLASP